VRQGVTTVIEGPDGSSPVPLAPFLTRLEGLRKTVNIGSFIGHGSVREAVIGRVNRPASEEELDKMRALVEQGMNDGAFGLSSGLILCRGICPDRESSSLQGRRPAWQPLSVPYPGEGGRVVGAVTRLLRSENGLAYRHK
jgi:hypothetical protein